MLFICSFLTGGAFAIYHSGQLQLAGSVSVFREALAQQPSTPPALIPGPDFTTPPALIASPDFTTPSALVFGSDFTTGSSTGSGLNTPTGASLNPDLGFTDGSYMHPELDIEPDIESDDDINSYEGDYDAQD